MTEAGGPAGARRRRLHPKHVEERLKLGASGLQATALTLIAGVVLAPALNGSLVAPVWARVATFIGASVAEMAAFRLLAYIPVSKEL